MTEDQFKREAAKLADKQARDLASYVKSILANPDSVMDSNMKIGYIASYILSQNKALAAFERDNLEDW